MNLENRLRDVETNGRDRLHDLAPPNRGGLNSTHIHGTHVPSGGAVHSIKSGHPSAVSRRPLGQDFFTICGLLNIPEFHSVAAMSDKRAKQRQRVLKPAKIGLSRGGVIDCIIRDISEDGACLKVASTLGVPDVFELILDDKTMRRCCIKWRKETQIGVEFQSQNASTTDTQKHSPATSHPVLVVEDSPTMT